jgi:osmoprotectant transport system permease protein
MRLRLQLNPVSAVLSLSALAAVVWLPFLRVAPNRMVSGDPVFLRALLQGPVAVLGALLVALLLVLALSCCFKPSKTVLWLQIGTASALMALLLAAAGAYASHIAATQSPYARTSLGGAWWVLMIVLWLMAQDALQRLQVGLRVRTGLLAAIVLPVGWMLLSGWCNDLSIMKEYANRSDMFGTAVVQHMLIVLLAMVPTVLIGVPLGWWMHKVRATQQSILPVLNVIQTIPSIALFGLLMAPLAWLATAFPALAKAGISGVGMAPGVIALVLYALLPVVRGTLAGLELVPSGVVNAARGMGMSEPQVFTQVELPLALPVLLSGVRTATVSAVGLASVTALIGAGGLGAIMFEGLFSSAQDLVLLGVLPIVALSVATDAVFKVLVQLVQPLYNAVSSTERNAVSNTKLNKANNTASA